MTDNEILKAFEICMCSLHCFGCPYYDLDGDVVCYRKLFSDITNIINRLQAEVERLNGCVKSEDEFRAIMKSQMAPMVKEIVNEQIDVAMKVARAEAIKEVLDRFDIEYCKVFSIPEISFMKEFKRVFLKEMVGENNA